MAWAVPEARLSPARKRALARNLLARAMEPPKGGTWAATVLHNPLAGLDGEGRGMKHVAVVLALAVSPVGSAGAQESVPGAATEIVRLDAVVTDAGGKPVRNLSREDFELRDEGKVQRLTQFLYVGRDAAPPAPAAVAPDAAAQDVAAQAAPPRHLAILVDDLHITPSNAVSVKEALHRLVAEHLSPGDRVALVTTSSPAGVHRVTQDPAEAAKEIEALSLRQAPIAPARGSQMTAEQAELILRGDRSALLLAGRMIKDEPGSVYEGMGGPRAAAASLPGA